MKKIYKTFFLLILNSAFSIHNSFSQTPLIKLWDKRFGGPSVDYLYCIKQTSDAGFILGGFSASGIGGDKTQPSWGDRDFWIVKTDSLGDKQWDKRFGGIYYDWLVSIQQTSDGGYILGGKSSSGISGDKTQPCWGQFDYWIVKIDSSGNKQWDKRFGGTDFDNLTSVIQTFDGGYLMGGMSASDIGGDKTESGMGWDYWIVKTDSLGNKQWDKDFGGNDAEVLYSMQQTSDGGYILGGFSASGSSGDKTEPSQGFNDYWILKIDASGNKQWDKGYGGTYYDELYSLHQTTDKGYILGGLSKSGIGGDKTQSSWGDYDYWIIKTDSSGNVQWDKDFGGTSSEPEFGNVNQTSDGGYIIGGNSFSPLSGDKTENNFGTKQSWIIKTDSLGNKQWDRTIFTTGPDMYGYALETSYGCYVFANFTQGGVGGYKTQDSRGANDYWIIKFCDTTITGYIPPLLIGNPQFSPNPLTTQSKLTFKNPNKEKLLFTLYDITGRITETVSTTNNEIILTKGSKPAGVYLFNLVNEKTGERMNGKIVISN